MSEAASRVKKLRCSASLLLALLAPATTHGQSADAARFSAETPDFGVRVFIVDDRAAFLKMWAKPDPPQIRLLDVVQTGKPATVVVLYAGGHPDAQGNCDMVYSLSLVDEQGTTLKQAPDLRLCTGHAPLPRLAQVLAETLVDFVPDEDAKSITVHVRVTDRPTGRTAEVSQSLEVVSSLFRMESIHSLDEMTAMIGQRFAPGSTRTAMRKLFIGQGRSTLKLHPTQPGVEKYLYDINLCSYYVWRWNISADYDEGGSLKQAYVNGDPVFPDGTPKRVVSKVAEPGKKASILRGQRARPEASKGESSLGYILFDRDSDLTTIDDQVLIGAGPSRPNPVDMGKMHVYSEVDPWRSIFDSDRTAIVDDPGDCSAVDAAMKTAIGNKGS